MTHEFKIKQPIQLAELKLNKIIYENPNRMNALDRGVNHPIIRKCKNVPIPDENCFLT